MHHLVQLTRLAFAAVAVASCSAPRPAPPVGRDQAVLTGLRPKILIKGSPATRWPLAERMAEHHVPGVSIAVIDSGRIAWARAFGIKEADLPDSVTTETLFEGQSISKAIATTAMLRLVDQGKLDLDTPINTYLRSWKLPENRFTRVEKVTLRRVVSHSAGITVGGFPGYVLGDSLPTLHQLLDGKKPANSPPIRVDTFPGAIWRYSGGGIMAMQQLLIDVTQEPFPVLAQRLVFGPLAMTRSTFEQPLPTERRAEAVSGHDGQGAVIRGKWPVHPEQAAGGIWTTPTDLARWAIGIADAWAGRSEQLLSRKTATEMLTIQKDEWGLGVEVHGKGRALRFGHSGANRGFRADAVMFPALGKGAVVMTNGDNGDQLIAEILQAIAAEYGWPDYDQTERSIASIEPRLLDSIAGTYDPRLSPPWDQLRVLVTREADGIYFEIPRNHPKERIYPATADSFFTLTGSEISFTRDQTGRGVKISLGGQPAFRVP